MPCCISPHSSVVYLFHIYSSSESDTEAGGELTTPADLDLTLRQLIKSNTDMYNRMLTYQVIIIALFAGKRVNSTELLLKIAFENL